jgi:oligopeptide/dipeptide ABC transporter ATP-binding protein
MLDVSIRASFLELLKELQLNQGLNVLYISHNLSEIRYISQRMAVLYLGKIAEIGATEKLIDSPKHPYTKKLISAVPIIDPDRKRVRTTLGGEKPDPIDLPPGCRFQTLCPESMEACHIRDPELIEVEKHHFVACHLFGLVQDAETL